MDTQTYGAGSGVEEAVAPGAVLVVDDEFLIVMELEATLVAAGHAVVTAVSAEEAFDALDRVPVQLAILDFRIGGRGLELAATLVKRGVPLLFCTGAQPEEVREAFPEARVVAKPFLTKEVLDEVAALLNG